jgi:hypothetical protein
MSASGLLQQAVSAHTTQLIQFDDVDWVNFTEGRLSSIGTANLGGCSVAVLVSPFAAILAHIAPRPTTADSSLAAGDMHCREKMMRLRELYTQHQTLFPPGKSGVVICAELEGDVVLNDQMNIMLDCFKDIGVAKPTVRTYAVGPSIDKSRPGQGTVFVTASSGGPIIYIEDKQVNL